MTSEKRQEIQISMFTNKGLLEHSHLIHLPPVYGCFCVTMAELSSCNRDYVAHKPKVFTTWSFTEMFAFTEIF